MQGQKMRTGPAPKLQWKVVAVLAKEPAAFAAELERVLQELTDQGFAIHGQLPHGGGLIVSASRLPPADMASLRRRVVGLPSVPPTGEAYEEVLYHFMENGEQKQRSFPTLIDVLRVLREDLGRPGILPLNLTTIAMTRFEPPSFAHLLRMFAKDLQSVG